MTALDKQARELAIKLGACTWQDGYEEPGKYVAEESAVVQILAFATQVREQTVQECAQLLKGAIYDGESISAEIFNKIAAPPETTEQDGK